MRLGGGPVVTVVPDGQVNEEAEEEAVSDDGIVSESPPHRPHVSRPPVMRLRRATCSNTSIPALPRCGVGGHGLQWKTTGDYLHDDIPAFEVDYTHHVYIKMNV